MGTLATRELAAGWTAATYKAALLSLLAEVWGPYTLHNGPQVNDQYAEFADRDGCKVYANFPTATGSSFCGIANTSKQTTAGGRTYREYLGSAQEYSFYATSLSTANPARLVAVAGEGYTLFLGRAGSGASVASPLMVVVGLMQKPVTFWGASKVLFISQDLLNARFTPGRNPWAGAYNAATGTASPVGLTSAAAHQSQLPLAQNTLLAKRQVSRNVALGNAESVIGLLPSDLCFVARTGLTANTDYKVTDADGKTYFFVGTGGGGAVRYDAGVLFADLPTAPGYAVDMTDPTGQGGGTGPGETVVIVEPHPARRRLYGQLYPSPLALPAPQTGQPEP